MTTLNLLVKLKKFRIYHQNKNGVSYYDILLSTQPNYQIGTHFKIKLASNDIELPTSAIVQKRYVLILKTGKLQKRSNIQKEFKKWVY